MCYLIIDFLAFAFYLYNYLLNQNSEILYVTLFYVTLRSIFFPEHSFQIIFIILFKMESFPIIISSQ